MGIERESNMKVCKKEESKLYRIGVFAQMNRVTIKALRYYDDIGLLHPEWVDEENGYRYYTSSQMPRLHQILALKEIGFSITEIQQVFDGLAEEQLLLRKKNELLVDLAKTHKQLASIESYLAKDNLPTTYHVIKKSLPEVKVASKRVQLSSYEDLFGMMPAMGALMEQAGCECTDPDYCFMIYHDEGYKEQDVDVEICEAVTQLKESTEELQFKVMPAEEEAICILHKGPYENLPKAYQFIIRYIEENGYEIIGRPRDSYIDGVWNKDDEKDWLTQIQIPVRKR